MPRHSVYYIIPKRAEDVDALCSYLNSARVRQWLDPNCQRAANGFLRLQSRVLKRLPLSAELVERVRAEDQHDSARHSPSESRRETAARGSYAFEFAR